MRSSVVKKSLDATWDFATVFYRKKLNRPIVVQVWDSNVVVDTFLGQVSIEAPPGSGRKAVVLELRARKGAKSDERLAGQLTVEFQSEDDLQSI